MVKGKGALYKRFSKGLVNCVYSSSVTINANEGPVRIQYKCLIPIYVFPEMKNWYLSSQFLHSYICERFIYF
jgi:hypothetical protein